MEALLLAIYATIVWLIFFKFKLLPWTTSAKVIVVTIPVVGMITLILLLNVFAPSSGDVIVVRNSVGIVSRVKDVSSTFQCALISVSNKGMYCLRLMRLNIKRR